MNKHSFSALSFNTHKFLPPLKKTHRFFDLKDLLKKSGADFIFLQEFRGHHPTLDFLKKDEEALEIFADKVWAHFAYGKNAVYPAGNHGNAILSRFPIRKWHNADLTQRKLEKRGLLHVEVNLNEGSSKPVQSLHLLCTHLDLLERNRLKQCQIIFDYISKNIPPEAPVLLAGDFNDWTLNLHSVFVENGWKESFAAQHSELARTFPWCLPRLRLDRIYYRHLEVESAKCLQEKSWVGISDHLALQSQFKI